MKDLPTANAVKKVANQGWQLSTEIRPSTIAGAGNGRFALETMKVGADAIIKPLFPMADITTLASLPNSGTITFATRPELETFIDLMKSEGGHSREVVLDLYENFMYGFNGVHCCLNVSTWTVNHGDNIGDGLNLNVVERTLPDGKTALVGEVIRDIGVNDELYMDYRKFKLPEFYLKFTKDHNIKDVRTVVMEAVYGVSE